MADNLKKRPSKGILKNSSSFDRPEASGRDAGPRKSKETKWDEMNIIATLHPPDKDYGHMKVDEPKTPYNYADSSDGDELDASVLAEKIKASANEPPKFQHVDEEESDEDEDLTPEERARRKEFLAKRKKHYNEYYAVKLAKKKLEEGDDSDDDDEENCQATISNPSSPAPHSHRPSSP